MENIFGLATVTSIVVFCYLVGEGVKLLSFVKNEAIPVICGVVGGILGVIGMLTIPEFPATDYLSAIAVGIVSGLSATGVNQIFKQLTSTNK